MLVPVGSNRFHLDTLRANRHAGGEPGGAVLDQPLDHTGRKVVKVEVVRELTEADLERLKVDRGVRAPALKRLTFMHHSIARLVAQGEAGYAIALATGYSESRISILKSDPAFQELVARYQQEVEAERHDAYAFTQAKLQAISVDALEVIHERALDEETPTREVVEIAKMTLDRSGFGPASKSQNLNVNLDLAGQLAAGRQRAIELSAAVPAAQAGRVGMPSLPPGQVQTGAHANDPDD